MKGVYTVYMSDFADGPYIKVARWLGDNQEDIYLTFNEHISMCSNGGEVGLNHSLFIYLNDSTKPLIVEPNGFIIYNDGEFRIYNMHNNFSPKLSLDGCLDKIREYEEDVMLQKSKTQEMCANITEYNPIIEPVKAIQWNGNNIDKIIELSKVMSGQIAEINLNLELNHIYLKKAEGAIDRIVVNLDEGDFLVVSPKLGYYKCKEKDFLRKFCPVPKS